MDHNKDSSGILPSLQPKVHERVGRGMTVIVTVELTMNIIIVRTGECQQSPLLHGTTSTAGQAPGWVVTVITKAVFLLQRCHLYFSQG